MRTSAAVRTPAVNGQARPKVASKVTTKAKSRPHNSRAEARLFGKVMLVILIVVAALTAILVQRIAIMHTLIEADAAKNKIDKEVLIRDNLEARAASLAASPGIQRRATKGIGMVPARDVDFITEGKEVSARTLATDMRFFDRSRSKVKAYRAGLVQKAIAMKTKTATDNRKDVQGATIKASPTPPGQ